MWLLSMIHFPDLMPLQAMVIRYLLHHTTSHTLNITVPHKEKVMTLLDTIEEEASFIGAVNTIVNSHGQLKGHNTDGKGFMRSISESGINALQIKTAANATAVNSNPSA